MAGIGKLWAGKLYGTNTGNLFLELTDNEGKLSGTLRVSDDRFGLGVFSVNGSFDGTNIVLTGSLANKSGELNSDISVTGTLTAEGQVKGQWSSSEGAGGTFGLMPHDTAMSQTSETGLPPERVHTATRTVGALRLYRDDFNELIGLLKNDFNQGRVIATYKDKGNEVSRYASEIETSSVRIGELLYLKLYIQEPDSYGVTRFAMVELNATGTNEIRVQGVQESWVTGKAENVSAFLRSRQKTLLTTFRAFNLNLGNFLALATLVLLPDLTIIGRLLFVLFVAITNWLIVQIHSRFIPNIAVYLSGRQPSTLERAWPQILSWLIGATSALAAAIAYGLLRGELTWLPTWLHH